MESLFTQQERERYLIQSHDNIDEMHSKELSQDEGRQYLHPKLGVIENITRKSESTSEMNFKNNMHVQEAHS